MVQGEGLEESTPSSQHLAQILAFTNALSPGAWTWIAYRLWNVLHNASWFTRWDRRGRTVGYHFDAQAFLFAAHDMDAGEFAALDAAIRLARHAERVHRQEVLTGITVKRSLRSLVRQIRQVARGSSVVLIRRASLRKFWAVAARWEFVASERAAQPQSVEPQNVFEVREQHLGPRPSGGTVEWRQLCPNPSRSTKRSIDP